MRTLCYDFTAAYGERIPIRWATITDYDPYERTAVFQFDDDGSIVTLEAADGGIYEPIGTRARRLAEFEDKADGVPPCPDPGTGDPRHGHPGITYIIPE